MGKQSARLIFRGKDHKDIYFQGKYCNALYVCKDDTEPELYWRKLYDEGYFVYTFKTYYWSSYSRYTAIMYPKYKIREYNSFGSTEVYHSDKFFLRVAGMPSYKQCWISYDGKIWKKNDLTGLGLDVWYIIPKWDGIIICDRSVSRSSDILDYIYYPVKDGYIDTENAKMLYSDNEHGTTTGRYCMSWRDITDALLLFDNTANIYNATIFAVDINGNIYDDLFVISYVRNNMSGGCLNGMHWIIDGATTASSGTYPIYAHTSTNPFGEWKNHIIFSGNVRWNYSAIQAKDYIALYFAYGTSTAVRVYKTTDFTDLEQIDIPNNLLVPIIEPRVSENIKYVNIRLKPSAETRNDSINYNFLAEYFTGDMFLWNLNYVENQKISPFKGMLLTTSQTIGAGSNTDVTIYIDNLFFEESENNFAICESVYPEQYMNDYIEEE